MPYISATTSHVRIGTPLRRRARGHVVPVVSGTYCRIPGNVENFPILSLIYVNGVAGGIGYLLKTPNTGREPGLRLMV